MKELIDITEPTILGYAITPWFVVFCLCFIGLIVCAILVVSAFSKKDAREREMIESAVKNTSKIPVKSIDIPTIDFSDESLKGTEAINGVFEKTDGFGTTGGMESTEGFDIGTEGLSPGTEGFGFRTEGLDLKTEGLDLKTEGLNMQTEGLSQNNFTEAFSVSDSTESFENVDKTEGLAGESNNTTARKSKFCSKCGNKVNGKFCSRCGYEIRQ